MDESLSSVFSSFLDYTVIIFHLVSVYSLIRGFDDFSYRFSRYETAYMALSHMMLLKKEPKGKKRILLCIKFSELFTYHELQTSLLLFLFIMNFHILK